jgi:hypothetical protein
MDFKSRNNLKKYKMSANQIAAAGAIKFMSAVIIVSVVLYAEIMYLQIINSAFPDGTFRALATLGAIASGLSVLALVLGKMYWFPPGGQTIWAWCFTGIETTVLVLNLILSFEMHWHTVDPYMDTWRQLSPASPVFALIGWIVIWQLDRSTKARHAVIEQEAEELEAELDYRSQVHTAVMDLKHNYLAQTVENLKYEFSSAEVQAQLRQGARDLAAGVLSEFTNIPIAPRPARPALSEGRVVEADSGMEPAPLQYSTRKEDRGGKRGVLGAMQDVFTHSDESQSRKEDDPPDAQGAAMPVASAPISIPVALAQHPVLRRIALNHPEPSVVLERRRLRMERSRRRRRSAGRLVGDEPETGALPMTSQPEAELVATSLDSPEATKQTVRTRTKKKLPPLR